MNSVFITGIPTAGKSYLAETLSSRFDMRHVKMDDLTAEMEKDPALEPWVNLFWNKNECEYYTRTTCDEQWNDIVRQSHAFWPTMKKTIDAVLAEGRPAIFEGVNLLPQLMKETALPGVVLLGRSEEEVFARLQAAPRWGKTEELQRFEARAFFSCERVHYAKDAEACGYAAFSDVNVAEQGLIRLIQEV